MELQFTKMHGLGNDFIVLRWPEDAPDPAPEVIRRLSDRREGIGFDSMLTISAATNRGAKAQYRVFNADGGEAEQCGNGARCIADWLGNGDVGTVVLESAAGFVEARVLGDGLVSVNLGVPSFEPSDVPYTTPTKRSRYQLELADGAVEFGIVSMGNPHAVISVDSVEGAWVGILGHELNAHAAFPHGVNVGFMERVDSKHIRLRVYERGIGETCACGTGAAAAVAVGRSWDILDTDVDVSLPGGVLKVNWPGPGAPLWQTGQTRRIYEGRVSI
jgi:diaminopimelate epimerase